MIDMINQVFDFNDYNLKKENTMLVIVDMVNGFLTQGALASPRCAEIIPQVRKLLILTLENQIPVLAFADSHRPDSPEFRSFPVHCLENTPESEIEDSLQALLDQVGNVRIIPKNSTNGFFAPDFQKYLWIHPELQNFIVCGVCTDICVMQFALTLQAWANQNQKKLNIFIPVNAVATYDAPGHDAESLQKVALEIMQQAGINLINFLR
ncbi:MAG: cysteine hydrolase [Oscillospiraceae bacterium]|nr:cysteine hydrolase [Oscillospiraceae bacterium]